MTTDGAALIVVAAGTGTRLGREEHKALVPVGGIPLVERTLRHLLTCEQLDPVILVGHADDQDRLAQLMKSMPRPVTVVAGGARRQDSVQAGLAAIPEGLEIVLVHDAARPFVPLPAMGTLIARAREHGCALLAAPVADTIKAARPDAPALAGRTVPRDGLWAAQTPQAFRRAALQERLDAAARDGRSVTDEAQLFEAGGLAVAFVKGSPLNFKITTPDDLRLAEAILAGNVVPARSERTEPCH